MAGKIDLDHIPEQELLDLRICDLPLKIEGTWIQDCIKKLYQELDDKGIKFKPPFYLADEWFTPDEEPIVGIPFFLAHPALMKIEKKFMLEVEGGTKQWCAKLLRHETGHAINYAYRLYKRKKWRKYFGRFSLEYPDTYKFRPYSRNYVVHLGDYYAQYHPDEDFAETFAVWLTPGLDWQSLYKGWKAIEKVKYVDELINEIKEKEPVITKGKKSGDISSLKIRLKNYYKKKRLFYAEDFYDFHDADLKKIFVEKNEKNKGLPLACDIIRKYKDNILNIVSGWTGERKYVISDLLKTIIQRSADLELLSSQSESVALLEISTYITSLIMNYIYTGRLKRKKCGKV